MVSTSDDGSCGIGTYTGDLMAEFPDSVNVNHVPLRLGAWNPVHYARAAISAGFSANEIVHVQHEYGIFGPKSIMSWVFFPLLFICSKINGNRIVITAHSAWNGQTVSEPLVNLKRVYVALNNSILARTSDYVIFLSDNCEEKFLQSASVGSYDKLSHGVQTKQVTMDEGSAKEQFGYFPDDTVIVEPGYVRPEKGQDVFVELAAEFPEYSFLIAGGTQKGADDEYLSGIERKSADNVQITGTLDDERFHVAFHAADLIVLPYRDVTQSGIFNWCVAHALPVAASDSEYFRRLQERWGCVSLFDVDDITNIVACTRELLKDTEKRQNLSNRMVDYQKSSSMESVADRHHEIYREISARNND